MRITQGAFAFLPDLTEDQIRRQIEYCRQNGWTVSIEHTDEVQSRDTLWVGWGSPLDASDVARVLLEIKACRKANPRHDIRINAQGVGHDLATVRLSFIITRPREEPVVRFDRPELQARTQRYRMPGAMPERRVSGARW